MVVPQLHFDLLDGAPRRLRLILRSRDCESELMRELVRAVRAAGIDLEVRVTFEGGDARRYAAEAAGDGRDIVAMGGDGTLHEAINGLCDAAGEPNPTSSALGILPGGTGNDFATALGLPTDDLVEAMRVVLNGRRQPVDLLKVQLAGGEPSTDGGDGENGGRNSGHHSGEGSVERVLNVATFGLGAAVTAEAPEGAKKWFGNLAYLISGMLKAHQLDAQEINVRGEDADNNDFHWRGPAFGIAVGNNRMAGGGANLLPKAKIDDGLLDLVICPEMPIERLVPVVGETMVGDLMNLAEESTIPDDPHRLVYRQLRRAKIDCLDPTPINLDGEAFTASSARFEVEPHRAWLFVPRSSPVIAG